jgi:hypothetical protein
MAVIDPHTADGMKAGWCTVRRHPLVCGNRCWQFEETMRGVSGDPQRRPARISKTCRTASTRRCRMSSLKAFIAARVPA